MRCSSEASDEPPPEPLPFEPPFELDPYEPLPEPSGAITSM